MRTDDQALPGDVLRFALDQESVGVAILKPLVDERDFRYVYVNPAYQALKPHVQMPGRTYAEVWPEAARLGPARWSVVETGEPWTERDVVVDVEFEGGSTSTEYFAVRYSRIDIDCGPYLLSEVRKTTDEVEARRRAERDLETTRLLLLAAEALTKPVKLEEVLGRLAEVVLGSTSHTRSFVFLWDEGRRMLTQAASAGRHAFPPGRTFTFESVSVTTQQSITDRRTVVVDFDALPEPQRGYALASQKSHVMLSVPVTWQNRLLAMIGVDDPGERREFTEREISIVEGIAAQAAISIENARLFGQLTDSLRAMKEKDRAIRQAYSDVIDAVTGGRLVILGRDEMAKVMRSTASESIEIREPRQLADARAWLRAKLPGFPDLENLVLAFSEAATNMLKHAGGGVYGVVEDRNRVRIVLSDIGPGIDFRDLPKATLLPGFSTQQTLGMGFSIMMELTDRLFLCSDSDGTTLVLEKNR